jgi:UDPglucose 6-dehydrogenase
VRITVEGMGYLGVTHAACMSELGHEVLGVDTDTAKVAKLREGVDTIYEPGLDALLGRHSLSGRLRFSTSYAEAAEFGDVHFLCVGTPQRPGSDAADLGNLYAAVEELAPRLHRQCVVVGKSTVPVGTAALLADRLAALAPAGDAAELAWNPEFLREGHAVEDTLRPERLVIGARAERPLTVLSDVYASIIGDGVPVVRTDFATAELTKAAANAFLATKISFINAIAEVCEVAGGDVTELARALGYDSRIGPQFLQAGIGFGGGCLPKDIRAFRARARELGIGPVLSFLDNVDEINLRSRQRLVELTRAQCGGELRDQKIAVLGAAFKPQSDDVRDSPALYVAASLHAHGAAVTLFDPKAAGNARRLFPSLGYATSVEEAVTGADVVMHLTEWPQFRALDPAELAALVAHRRIIDGRNTLDPARWRSVGWAFHALGRA